MTTRKKASKNLIKELSKESARFTRVALVVGFEESSQFLWNDDPTDLEKLKTMIQSGGEPVGMIAFYLRCGLVEIHILPLEEYASEERVRDYLHELAFKTVALIAKLPGCRVTYSQQSDAWLN